MNNDRAILQDFSVENNRVNGGGFNSPRSFTNPPTSTRTKVIEFKLGWKRALRKKQEKPIIQEIKEYVRKNPTAHAGISKKTLLKLISFYYNELNATFILAPQQQPITFASFIYSELSNKYGLKNVAETKFAQVK